MDWLMLIPITLAAAGLMFLLGSPSGTGIPEQADVPDAVLPVLEKDKAPVIVTVHAAPALIETRAGE